MKKLIILLALTTIFFEITAEAWPYTVMATSGIYLRAEPSKNGKRLISLPFGSVVHETENSENYYRFSEIDTTFIEGIRGHWIRVKSNSTEGYVFSGFVITGEWILPSRGNLNNDFQLLRSGSQWNAVSYDPKLNWYILDQKDNGCKLKPVNLTIMTWQGYPEAELEQSEADEFPFRILVNGKDTICWLLGSKETIGEMTNAFSSTISDPNSGLSFDFGLFFYPEQKFSFYSGAIEFQFAGKEEFTMDSQLTEGFKREYKLLYTRTDHQYPHGQDINEYDLSDSLRLTCTAALQSQYHTPTLVWVGDINGDQELDFILLTKPCYESNSGSESYHLFVSDKTSGTLVRKVAEYIIYYYDNC